MGLGADFGGPGDDDETTCMPGENFVCINEHSVYDDKYCESGECTTCIEYQGAVCSDQGGEIHDYRGTEYEQ